VVDWIVAIVSLFALVFVLLWFLAPGSRARVEQPKFEMLARADGRNRRSTKETDNANNNRRRLNRPYTFIVLAVLIVT
jgi:hypothetical protein